MTLKEQMPLIRVDKLYESLRYNEYSPENGMGEIVDNSVEAGAARIDLCITRSKQKGKGRPKTRITEIAVADNGCGMDFTTISKCLALGESIRPANRERPGIGRFGVGMTLGSISLARRVEVYSRTNPEEDFLYSYIDLDEVNARKLKKLPVPVPKTPVEEYAALLQGQAGTIVLLKNCDRIDGDLEGLAHYLGRTYRKFIERGLKLFMHLRMDGEPGFQTEPIYLHDPLYIAGPTKFDAENREKGLPMEPKATDWGTIRIPKEIENQPGKTADVIIHLTLLPEEWRKIRGDGGSKEAKKRKIHENEGVSILRADREVLYGHVPYITGIKGEAKSLDIDRFWGCEISFPPELDSYFQVRYIKRGAEPIESLKEQIRTELKKYIPGARKIIREFFSKNEAAADEGQSDFATAENTMAEISHNLPQGPGTTQVTPEEADNKLNLTVREALSTKRPDPQEQKAAQEKKKEELRSKPYSVELVSYPKSFFFETVHTPGSVIIKLNVNHHFYDAIMKPLRTARITDDSGSSRKTWDALLMMLFAYAKAETMFERENEALLEQLRNQWGAVLSTAIDETHKDSSDD